MKKSTHWITIPEEKIHTPASEKKGGKKDGKQDVKNKFLWGLGFVVIIVVAFALLAPDQFNSLLKGSLFDTSGVTENQMKVSLLPSKSTTSSDSTSTSSTSTSTTSTTSGSGTTSTTTTSTGSTVQPEEKAVSISVTPVSTTTTSTSTSTATTTTTAKDCGTDITCFLPYLKDCSLATVTHAYKVSGKDFEADLEITGSDNTDCKLTAEFTKSPVTALVDEEITCKLAQDDYTQSELEKVFSDKDELEKNCTGTAVDTLKAYLEGLTSAAATTTSDTKAVEDLKKQLEALTKIVADTQTKPAAATTTTTPTTTTTAVSTTPATTTTTTPASVATTTAIGQPSTVTPGFKTNPYTVTLSPQQVLQQNLASGTTYVQSTAATTSSAVTTAPTTTTISTTATPQTGPSEVILMTLILSFLGLVGWKFVRIFA